MPSPPTISIPLAGIATSDDVSAIRRELAELRKLIEAMAVPTSGRVLLSRAEGAEVMGISVSTFDALADLPRVKVAGRIMVNMESIRRWVESHESIESATQETKAA